ncbi:hypothetical protein EDB83DRAFT_1740655 [Lactarius deliciosus]|nr:hypothetical protein EDB83DRAFT_1740655 [Lactarius deliciosus]
MADPGARLPMMATNHIRITTLFRSAFLLLKLDGCQCQEDSQFLMTSLLHSSIAIVYAPSKMVATMEGSFPVLTHLVLHAILVDVPGVLIRPFLVDSWVDLRRAFTPCLQQVHLSGIPFPEFSTFLLSSRDLVSLRLDRPPNRTGTGFIFHRRRWSRVLPSCRVDQARNPLHSYTISESSHRKKEKVSGSQYGLSFPPSSSLNSEVVASTSRIS